MFKSSLILMICVFHLISSGAHTCDFSALSPGHVDDWVRELHTRVPRTETKAISWPPSMSYRFGFREKFEIMEAALKLKGPILESVPRLIQDVTGKTDESLSLDGVIETLKTYIYDAYGVSEVSKPYVEAGQKKLEKLWDHFRASIPLDGYRVDKFVEFSNRFEKVMNEFQQRYPEEIDADVKIGAGFGFMGARIILDSIGKNPKGMNALAAISLLHPLTDNALDRGVDVGPTMKKITLWLQGKNATPEGTYEVAVHGLIGEIYRDYPRAKHPELERCLMALHQAQIESNVIQRNASATEKELLDIAFRKGGYTALVLAYIAQGEVKPEHVEFYFKGGSIFQLGDDLLDVKEDKRDGVHTLWTRSKGDASKMRHALQLYANLQKDMEARASTMKSTAENIALGNDLILGFRFYLMSAYLNGEAGPQMTSLLKEKYPLSPANSRSVAFSLYRKITRETQIDPKLKQAFELYQAIFDKHFLQGQFRKFDETDNRSAKRVWKIRTWNPAFVFVRLADAYQRAIKNSMNSNNRVKRFFARLAFTLPIVTSGHLLYNLENADMRAVLAVTAGALVMSGVLKKENRVWFPVLSIVISSLYMHQVANDPDFRYRDEDYSVFALLLFLFGGI